MPRVLVVCVFAGLEDEDTELIRLPEVLAPACWLLVGFWFCP